MARGNDVVLRDVLNIDENAHAGDFKVALSHGFGDESAGRVAEYVVTEQLAKQFGLALGLVRGALRKNTSYAAYLHGTYGAGKSHFLTMLHAVLNGDPAAWSKPRLREVVAEHRDWLTGKRFLMVPYHLVGAATLDSALLDGYVKTVREKHPNEPTPPVYRSDALLADARSLRESIGDEAFVRLLPAGPPPVDDDGLPPIGATARADGPADEDADLPPVGARVGAPWTGEELDAAFAAPPSDERRRRLVSALLDGPMKSYATGKAGDADAFVPLDDGLSTISKHARSLGYDGVILFLDELILWLQARMRERTWVNEEIQKLVKLIEAGNADRPVPIVSFISRQKDLSQLVGKDIVGSDVQNMEKSLAYLKERFTVIDLEDRNLPEIIKERVLRPRAGQEQVLQAAFAGIDRSSQQVKEVLLDGDGATSASWDDFRAVYPLSPALLNVLVVLSGALQRERSGLKLVQQLLEKNATAPVGQLIPLGDLWDVLVDGTGVAFTEKLKHEATAADTFHIKVREQLLNRYGDPQHKDFLADDRVVKTLLLAALAPEVPALRRLTGARLAALNHGSLRSRTVPPGDRVVERLRALQGTLSGELRIEGERDPVFSLHLSTVDIEPLLKAAEGEDKQGPRRVWVRDRLWELCGVRDGELVSRREIVWRGTRRTVEFVFGNVRNERELADEQFTPSEDGHVRLVFDYPFDEDDNRYPVDDFQRWQRLYDGGHHAPTLVWLPHFFSEQRRAQLGRLMKINFLLERDRLNEFTQTYTPDDRAKARRQLEVNQEALSQTLVQALAEVYGIAQPTEATVGAEVPPGRHVLSLSPQFPRPVLQGGKTFEDNVLHLAGGLFGALYPKHPDFGSVPVRAGRPRALTAGDLRTALEWITRAMDTEGRVEVETRQSDTVKRVVEPLELGTVHEGPLVLRADWRTRINQAAAAHRGPGDLTELAVEDIRRWITRDLGYAGLETQVTNLLIAAYALLDDRAWVSSHSGREATAPDLVSIGPGWALRAQPLPEKEEYEVARDRAARLFGVSAKPQLYARNVGKLAAEVRAKVDIHEGKVADVRATLERHAALLGLDGDAPAPRTVMLREAAAVLARLARHGDDATALVKELAAVTYDTPERELSYTMSSAAEVLRALDDTEWRVLLSLRQLSEREDSIGDRADRLLARLVEAARAGERERPLVSVLREARESAMAIVEAALHVEQAVPSPPPPADPGQVSLSVHGTPRVPSQGTGETAAPGAGPAPAGPAQSTGAPAEPTDPAGQPGSTEQPAHAGRRVIDADRSGGLENLLTTELTAVREEIEQFRARHPHTAVEIVWRPVGSDRPGAEDAAPASDADFGPRAEGPH